MKSEIRLVLVVGGSVLLGVQFGIAVGVGIFLLTAAQIDWKF